MNLAVEIQTQNVQEPELVLEIGDHEAKDAFERILDWVEQHPEDVGYDDPLLRKMVEEPDEPDTGIHKIREQLQAAEPVLLEGKLGKAVIHAVEVVAESEEMQAPQIPALRILRILEEESTEHDLKEAELSFADKYLLERLRGDKRQEPDQAHDAHLQAQRDATGKRLLQVVENEQVSDAQPEPIWVDKSGRELVQGEYIRLHNADETIITQKAIQLLREDQERKGRALTTGFDAMDQHLEEGEISFDLRGEEAQVARRALKLVANGLLKKPKMETDHNLMLQKQAKRMLDIREQGPKAIEAVEFEPEDQIQFTDTKHPIKPDLKVLQGGAEQSVQSHDHNLAA